MSDDDFWLRWCEKLGRLPIEGAHLVNGSGRDESLTSPRREACPNRLTLAKSAGQAIHTRVWAPFGLNEQTALQLNGATTMENTSPLEEASRIPATMAAPRLARRKVAAACQGMDRDVIAVAELLTSELVCNAVEHGGHYSGRQAEIIVSVRRTVHTVRVGVHDADPQPLPPVRPPPTPGDSGMGLYVVSLLADDWGFQPAPDRAGKVVWFEISAAGPA